MKKTKRNGRCHYIGRFTYLFCHEALQRRNSINFGVFFLLLISVGIFLQMLVNGNPLIVMNKFKFVRASADIMEFNSLE